MMQFIVVLCVAALFVKYFWALVAIIAAIWIANRGVKLWGRHEAAVAAEARRLDAIRARADQQHSWRMQGDPRGTYGESPTATT